MSTNNLPNMAYVSGKLTNFVFVSNYIVVQRDSFPWCLFKVLLQRHELLPKSGQFNDPLRGTWK